MKKSLAMGIVLLAVLSVTLPVAAEEPVEKPFVIQIQEFPPSLDVQLQADAISGSFHDKVHRGLVDFDSETLAVRPAIAESWQVLDDGKRIRFHLRKGAKFHNGREIVAGDFVFSFQRLLSLKPTARAAWALHPILGAEAFAEGKELFIDGLVAVDDKTLEITLEEPFSPIMQHLAMSQAAVLAFEEVAPKEGSPNPLPVGAGPFRVEKADRGEGWIVLRSFGDFYGQVSSIDRVEMQVVEETDGLLEGDSWRSFDLITTVPTALETGTESLDLHRWNTLSLAYLAINTRSRYFPIGGELRSAVAAALDRDAICRDALSGNCETAKGVVPPGIPGHDASRPLPPRDKDRAMALLEKAGHPDGKNLPSFGLWYQDRPERRLVAEAVAAQLEEVGFSIDLKPMPWARLLEEVRMGRPDLLIIGWAADYPDPFNFLFPLLESSGCGPTNHACYRNADFDALLAKGKKEADTEVRLALYHEAESLALADLPIIPLYHDTQAILIRPDWKGLVLNPIGWGEIPLQSLEHEAP